MAHSARATLSVLPACAVEATAAATKAVALGAPTAVIVASAAHAPAVTHSTTANALVRAEYMCAGLGYDLRKGMCICQGQYGLLAVGS